MADSDKKLVLGNVLMWMVTLLYTASPIDLVPDFIPLLGQADDAMGWLASIAVTAYTVYRMQQKKRLAASGGIRGAEAPDTAAEDAYEPWSLDQIRSM